MMVLVAPAPDEWLEFRLPFGRPIPLDEPFVEELLLLIELPLIHFSLVVVDELKDEPFNPVDAVPMSEPTERSID